MELYENKTDVNEKRISPPTDTRSDYYHTLIYTKTLYTTLTVKSGFKLVEQ